MNRRHQAVLLFFLLPAYVGEAFAQAQGPESERNRFENIRTTVEKREFFPGLQLGGPIDGGSIKNLCGRAFRDIATGPGFEPIEPVLQTDHQHHRLLEPWTRCWKSEEFIARTGVAFGFGTQAFRLYRVDLDSNPKNGLEQVLYAEWDHKKPPAHFSARFKWMDPRTCNIRGGAPIVQRDTRDEKGVGSIYDSHAALVRYRQTIWALEVHSLAATFTKSLADSAKPPAASEYRLSMTTLPNAAGKSKGQSCSWSTLKQ